MWSTKGHAHAGRHTWAKQAVTWKQSSSHSSEPAKHLKQHSAHCFSWTKLHVEYFNFKRQIAEGLHKKQKNPTSNRQVKCYHYNLFPLEIT